MVLLIGNYVPDRWPSMLHFGRMMLDGLREAGVDAVLVRPPAVFGRIRFFGATAAKWLGYIDKFLVFRWRLWRALAACPAAVHICDHSNATYARAVRRFPLLITCHDLFSVRAALGEQTDYVPSFTGRILQRWILRGLKSADLIACVSNYTAQDIKRLVMNCSGQPRIAVVPLGLNRPFRPISGELAHARLEQIGSLDLSRAFILHVGSNTPRKNRAGVLRIFARLRQNWDGQLVLAGELLDAELQRTADYLGISDRLVQIEEVSGDLLEALYTLAVALVFPSRFEGFGWPVIEAHACGCPVVCSNSGPLPEVGGDAALFHGVDDEAGFAEDLLRLTNRQERARWSAKALENAKRFSTERMIAAYRELYRTLAPAC
jgi:glycosyltransferase involved in cell wall biosynthesis